MAALMTRQFRLEGQALLKMARSFAVGWRGASFDKPGW
jgi:hypothetical protein